VAIENPQPQEQAAFSPAEIITFYSYKGGTGRTMALANLGCLLALRPEASRGVLIVDWDLEAPGLHRYFTDRLQRAFGSFPESNRKRAMERHPGVIDLFERLRERVEGLEKYEEEPPHQVFEDLAKVAPLDEFIIATDVPGVSLLKAGCFDEDYAKRVNTFPWEPLYHRAPWLITLVADWLASRFSFVLIDSRTGITDTSGICTMLLPDKLVMVFTPNAQGLEGVLEMTERATKYRRTSTVRPLGVFPLPSRIEGAEPKLLQEWRKGENGYQPAFERLFRKIWRLPSCNLENYFAEVQIQHVSTYAYGEKVAALLELDDNRIGLRRSFAAFAEKLVSMGDSWEAPERVAAMSRDEEVARSAAAIYAGLQAEQQDLARRLFLGFVQMIQGEPRTVGTVSWSNLSESLRSAAEPFLQGRVLLRAGDALRVDCEKLAQAWDQLQDWTKGEQSFLSWHSLLSSTVADWMRRGRSPREVLRGLKLAESEAYLQEYGELLEDVERQYILASVTARQARRKRSVANPPPTPEQNALPIVDSHQLAQSVIENQKALAEEISNQAKNQTDDPLRQAQLRNSFWEVAGELHKVANGHRVMTTPRHPMASVLQSFIAQKRSKLVSSR
jgi:hypothetical protein